MAPVGESPFNQLPDELLKIILERRMWDAGNLHFSKSRERIQLELVCKRFQALVRLSPSLEWDLIGPQRESSLRNFSLARTTSSLQKLSLAVESLPCLLANFDLILSRSEGTLEEVHLFIVDSSETRCGDYENLFVALQACPKLAVLEIVLFQSKVDLDFANFCKPFQSLRFLLLDGFCVYKSALGSLLETFPLLKNRIPHKEDIKEEPPWSKFFWWDNTSGLTQSVAPVPRTLRLVLRMVVEVPSTHALQKLERLMVGCRTARVASNFLEYLEVLIALMLHDDRSIQLSAGHALYYIVNGDDTRSVLTRVRSFVEGLMEILSGRDPDMGLQLSALEILGLLACDGQSKEATAAFVHRVAVLTDVLEKGSLEEVDHAMIFIDKLMEDIRIRRMLVRLPGLGEALVFSGQNTLK